MLWSLNCTKLRICNKSYAYIAVAKCIFCLPSFRSPSTTEWLDKRCRKFLTMAFIYTLCWRWLQWCCNCRRACWSSDGVNCWLSSNLSPPHIFSFSWQLAVWSRLSLVICPPHANFLPTFSCKISIGNGLSHLTPRMLWVSLLLPYGLILKSGRGLGLGLPGVL